MHSKTMAIINDTQFPLADANGNCVSFIDEAGNVQAHYTYDAFGNTVSQTGAMTDDFPFRFSSKYLDDETGLYYYGYRYMSPELGRWISTDPIGERGGLLLYGFVENNGVNKHDFLGLKCTLISGPTIAPGATWKMTAIDFDKVSHNHHTFIYGVSTTWALDGEVKCCCDFVYFWKKTKTVKVYKIVEFSERFDDMMIGWDPTKTPTTMPTPTNLLLLLRDAFGTLISINLPSSVILDKPQTSTINDVIKKNRPTSTSQGSWPEDPCN